jgi:hypothetical protein
MSGLLAARRGLRDAGIEIILDVIILFMANNSKHNSIDLNQSETNEPANSLYINPRYFYSMLYTNRKVGA